MSKRKLLNFDLDSIDKNSEEFESERKKISQIIEKKITPSDSGKSKTSWVIIVVVVIVVGYILSNSSSTVSPDVSASPSTSTKQTGDFQCSSVDNVTAEKMKPSASELSSLNLESDRLDTISSQLSTLESKINNTSVTQYSPQYLIDSYNNDVSSYNSKLSKHKSDLTSYNSRLNAYNKKVDSYNAFLAKNCK
jgi:peptidoglycan hydrolase CwlO-like protein